MPNNNRKTRRGQTREQRRAQLREDRGLRAMHLPEGVKLAYGWSEGVMLPDGNREEPYEGDPWVDEDGHPGRIRIFNGHLWMWTARAYSCGKLIDIRSSRYVVKFDTVGISVYDRQDGTGGKVRPYDYYGLRQPYWFMHTYRKLQKSIAAVRRGDS